MPTTITSHEFAEKASALISSITPVMQSMTFPIGERIHFSLSLVKSSIDIGHAATTLISTGHSFNGMAALVLMRPQLEHLFRGIYLGTSTLANDEFVANFKKGDEWKGPNFQKLSEHAASVLCKAPMGAKISDWQKLPNMVKFVKNSLHEFVHGGIGVVNAYAHATGITFSPEHFDNGQTITNIVSTAIFGFNFAHSISMTMDAEKDHVLETFFAEYKNWEDAAKSMGIGLGE